MKKERSFLLSRGIISLILAIVGMGVGVWLITFSNLQSSLAWLCICASFLLGVFWATLGVFSIIKFSKGGGLKELKKPATFLHYFLFGGLIFGAIVYLIKPTRRVYEPVINFSRTCFHGVINILLLALPIWLVVSFFVAFTGWLIMVYFVVRFLILLFMSKLSTDTPNREGQWKAVYDFDVNRKIYIGNDDYFYTEKGDKTSIRLIGNEIYNINNVKVGEIVHNTLSMAETEYTLFRV